MLRCLFHISLAVSAAIVANAARAEATLTLDEAQRLAQAHSARAADASMVRREVTAAWLSVWGAARTAALLRELQAEYRRSVDAATASVSGGRGTLGDVYAARQRVNQAEDRLLELTMQAERSAAQLARWTGETAAISLTTTPQWRDPPPLPKLLEGLADAQHAAARAELQGLYGEWRHSGERLANYDANILPDGQARVEALAVGYAAGRSDFGLLLEARRTLFESRVQRVTVEVAQARARAALEQFERTH